ncbi:hypothetical protein ABZ912_20140 [Nonomuraea angiospora]|uniref:hypothetical protein n=1 Tax=Nonomuraea angiospora TaxID=46172 RepID=UPI0033D8C495
MTIFLKLATLAAVIVCGSLLTLWMAFVSVPFACLALVCTVGSAGGVIVSLARSEWL